MRRRVPPSTGVRPRRPVARRRRRRTGGDGWRRYPVLSCRDADDGRLVVRLGSLVPASGRARRLRAASPQARRRRDRSDLDPGRDRVPAGRHHRRLAVVVAAAPGVCRSVAGPRPSQRTGAPGAVVPAHRGDLRRGHHLAARDRRRRAATGTTATPGSGMPSLTIEALWVAACPDEANEFFDYITASAAGSLERRRRPPDHVRHRRRARPDRAGAAAPAGLARIGPGAGRERRVAPAPARRLRRAAQRGAPALRPALRPVGRVGPQAEAGRGTRRPSCRPARDSSSPRSPTPRPARWQETGPWHLGGPRRTAALRLLEADVLGRARAGAQLADRLGAAHRVEAWTQTRDRIRQAILQEGWNDRVDAFTQSFGSDELDASNLMVPIVGFLPADDPRVLATIDATEERLTDERGLVYRYRVARRSRGRARARSCSAPSGSPRPWPWPAGPSGRGPCSSERRGVRQRRRPARRRGRPASGELLGNFPQAFSHIGLVNAAWAISQAEAASTP